jgi:large subunit ribosomal protein L18
MDRSRARREARKTVRKRIRQRVKGTAERPRLAVFKSGKHVYAQVIDDGSGSTLAAASSLDEDFRKELKTGGGVAAATKVGALVAQRARAKGIQRIVFDRGGYIYHGKIKALADAARQSGLEF